MKDWLKTTLGSHVDIITGYPFKSELYTEAEKSIRLLRGDNIIPGSTRWDGVKYWSLDKTEGLNKYYLNSQDLIIAMDRVLVSNGLKIAIIQEKDIPALLVQRVARLRANKGLDQKFLPYLVMSHRFEQYVKSVQTETAIPHISTQQINDFPIVLPPLLEQCRIAEVLGVWDESIDLLERLIGKTRSRKQGLMQQLLTGKKRFKEFEGSEWKTVKLSDFFTEISKKNTNNEDLVVLSCSKVYGIVPQSSIFAKRIASENTKRYKIVEVNNLVYDPMLLWDASIGFVESVNRGVISPAYNTFKYKGSCDVLPYFRYLFKSYEFKEIYKIISQGTNVRRRKAPAKTFLSIEFEFPQSVPEQEKIAAVLSAADEEISTLEKQLAAYKQQKLGLMQQLLTGKIRVGII
jgi:type I restriction enzyme, S subunit